MPRSQFRILTGSLLLSASLTSFGCNSLPADGAAPARGWTSWGRGELIYSKLSLGGGPVASSPAPAAQGQSNIQEGAYSPTPGAAAGPSSPPLAEWVTSRGGKIGTDEMTGELEINVAAGNVTDADLTRLLNAPAISSLDLSGTDVSDNGVKVLAELSTLRVLKLNDTDCTDACAEHLLKLNRLEFLGLATTEIGDGALASISEMSQLRYLLLDATNVTDKGLKSLHKLSGLEGISLVETAVTAEGVAELEKALPNCVVLWRSAETAPKASPGPSEEVPGPTQGGSAAGRSALPSAPTDERSPLPSDPIAPPVNPTPENTGPAPFPSATTPAPGGSETPPTPSPPVVPGDETDGINAPETNPPVGRSQLPDPGENLPIDGPDESNRSDEEQEAQPGGPAARKTLDRELATDAPGWHAVGTADSAVPRRRSEVTTETRTEAGPDHQVKHTPRPGTRHTPNGPFEKPAHALDTPEMLPEIRPARPAKAAPAMTSGSAADAEITAGAASAGNPAESPTAWSSDRSRFVMILRDSDRLYVFPASHAADGLALEGPVGVCRELKFAEGDTQILAVVVNTHGLRPAWQAIAWDATTGRRLKEFYLGDDVAAAAFVPNSSLVILSRSDGQRQVVDLSQPQPVVLTRPETIPAGWQSAGH